MAITLALKPPFFEAIMHCCEVQERLVTDEVDTVAKDLRIASHKFTRLVM